LTVVGSVGSPPSAVSRVREKLTLSFCGKGSTGNLPYFTVGGGGAGGNTLRYNFIPALSSNLPIIRKITKKIL
jgi:hypothetical protein